MITITEKDGATIIVVENPTATEKRVIEQAKNTQKAKSTSSVWSKFACNKNKTAKTVPETKPAEMLDLGNLDDFETIYDPNEDVPF